MAVESIDSILARLDRAIGGSGGTNSWDDETRSAFRQVLVDWRDEISSAGALKATHFKVIGRWFLDADVDPSEIGEMAMELDNRIYDCTHRP
jgi:hypothetical protein